MRRLVCAAAIVVAATGCNQPVKLEFQSPPPDRVYARGPLTLPAVQAKNADGAVMPDVKVTMSAEPSGILVESKEGPMIANRGDVTLTWSTEKKVTLTHPLRVLLPTRVELRCLPSCFGTIGGETRLETIVYSEADVIGELKAPCTTDRPSVAKVEGDMLKFLDKGEATLTCKLEDAVVTKKIDVAAPAPAEPTGDPAVDPMAPPPAPAEGGGGGW